MELENEEKHISLNEADRALRSIVDDYRAALSDLAKLNADAMEKMEADYQTQLDAHTKTIEELKGRVKALEVWRDGDAFDAGDLDEKCEQTGWCTTHQTRHL